MIVLRDYTANRFLAIAKKKKIIIYGAGTMGELAIGLLGIEDRIFAVIDSNTMKHGQHITVNNRIYCIISLMELENKLEREGDEVIILITPSTHMNEIVNTLDNISVLDKKECVLFAFMRQNFDNDFNISFHRSKYEIPKKIHYIWIGSKEIPKDLKYYIETWEKTCPDYQIIKWDESNYDFSKNKYMHDAFKEKQWSFATDFARLDIIYNEGGIYLDTDVELLKSLDNARHCQAFFGFADAVHIGTGVGFGAVKKTEIIQDMMDYYDEISFYNEDGTLNRRPCVFYQNPVFLKYGFNICSNEYQVKDDVVIFPNLVFSPIGTNSYSDSAPLISNSTLGIHHNKGAWIPSEQQENKKEQQCLFNRLK